jgi:hypothetical protein
LQVLAKAWQQSWQTALGLISGQKILGTKPEYHR